MKIEIIDAHVFLYKDTDLVYLKTNLPSVFTTYPNLFLRFDTPYDTGARYCLDHFNINPKIIDLRKK